MQKTTKNCKSKSSNTTKSCKPLETKANHSTGTRQGQTKSKSSTDTQPQNCCTAKGSGTGSHKTSATR